MSLFSFKSRKRSLAFLIFAAVVAFLAYWAKLGFDEDAYFSRHSLSYYLLIRSNLIRQCPQIDLISPPTFYYSGGDGNKLPANGILYHSNRSPQELRVMIREYLVKNGFRESHEETYFKGEKSSVSLDIEVWDPGFTFVRVTEHF